MDKTKEEMKYAEMFSRWYSWGSPVGLGLFIISIALTVLISVYALGGLVDAGKKGVEIEKQVTTQMEK